MRWHFDFSGASRWFFSISGCILTIGAISLATKQLNLGIDFTSGAKITASLPEPASIDDVRNALENANVDNASSAEIQTVDNPKLGPNVIEIQGKIPIKQVNSTVQKALEQNFGLQGGADGFSSDDGGPDLRRPGGAQRGDRDHLLAARDLGLHGDPVRGQVRDPGDHRPAPRHPDHGGVYSLTGQEVTSGTVAAFLTILGYSMYDTVIVFDRIRENVPRMPRAAFSQIANKSMSEVLTRSLITGLSTVFLVAVLLHLRRAPPSRTSRSR